MRRTKANRALTFVMAAALLIGSIHGVGAKEQSKAYDAPELTLTQGVTDYDLTEGITYDSEKYTLSVTDTGNFDINVAGDYEISYALTEKESSVSETESVENTESADIIESTETVSGTETVDTTETIENTDQTPEGDDQNSDTDTADQDKPDQSADEDEADSAKDPTDSGNESGTGIANEVWSPGEPSCGNVVGKVDIFDRTIKDIQHTESCLMVCIPGNGFTSYGVNDISEGNYNGTGVETKGFFVEFGGYADGADPGQPDNTKKGETNVLVAPMDAEAVINGVKYAPLADALDTAQAGDTVEIVKDTVTEVAGGTLKKGVKLKSKNGTWFSAPDDAMDATLDVAADGTVTLKDGTLNVSDNGTLNVYSPVDRNTYKVTTPAGASSVVVPNGTGDDTPYLKNHNTTGALTLKIGDVTYTYTNQSFDAITLVYIPDAMYRNELVTKAEVPADKAAEIKFSYSWSSDRLVLELAQRLISHGVDVVLDKWELKEGQDKYAFMERCVNDPDITKVLIICDRVYAQKANNRTGGVGDETVIISGEIYGKMKQEKFIPIIAERGDEGNEYLPAYIKTRIYIDLSDTIKYEEQYEKLLRNIYEKPQLVKPKLGKRPEWLDEEKTNFFPLKDLIRQIHGSNILNKSFAVFA